MAEARFVLDPRFPDNLAHTRGSVNRLGTILRRRTDEYARAVRRVARAEAEQASRVAGALREVVIAAPLDETRDPYRKAKATAWALSAYADSVIAVMRGQADGEHQTVGRVLVTYPGAIAIEFGGVDTSVRLGDTDEHLYHAPRALLRRAIAEQRS